MALNILKSSRLSWSDPTATTVILDGFSGRFFKKQVIYYNVDGYDVSSKITTIEWSETYHDDFYQYRNDEYLYLDPSGQDRISIEFQVKADRY